MKKILIGTLLALLCFSLYTNYKLTQDLNQEQRNHSKTHLVYLDTLIKFTYELNKIEQDFNLYQEQLPTLKVLQDAGIQVKNVYDLQTLIAEGDKLPYGSPFSGGHRVTSRFGHRNEVSIGGRRNDFHEGIDLVPRTRDKFIYATADGEIVDFGYDEWLGKYIVFETETGYRLKYGHLRTIYWQDIENRLVKNIKVLKGSKLGFMGNTGKYTTGAHLHFAIYRKVNISWVLLNPENIINQIGRNGSAIAYRR
jgi:murein DD-endopeptidase MepM/ murein hydrolase activator NlpD